MPDKLKFGTDGAAIFCSAVCDSDVSDIATEFKVVDRSRAGTRSFAKRGKHTNNLISPHGRMGQLAMRLIGPEARAVRILFFDKTIETNWAVPWHQDRVIAVENRFEVDGFVNWSIKDGTPHVEPPIEILSNMLTLRLHLDDCGTENGPMEILVGFHNHGRNESGNMREMIENSPATICTAARGDVLAMRLTTVHRSAKAIYPSRRRVLHVDYSPDELPDGLKWFG